MLTIIRLDQPQNGSVMRQGELVIYSPLVGFSGSDAFTYSVSDGRGGTASAVVSVSVFGDTFASTVWIDAAQGGSIRAGDSTLLVPSGALTQSTFITISEPILGMTMQADGMKVVSLEPSGLEFSIPATLTIAYGDPGSYDEDLMEVAALSEQTGQWEPQAIVAQDKTANTVDVRVEHFSSRFAYIDDPLYVVMEIPGKFLKPGHVLVRMDGHYDTGKPANGCNGTAVWLPGHTGIFSHVVGATPNSAGDPWLIEANVGGDFQWSCLAKGDVHTRRLDDFITESCGFYMGAMYHISADENQMNRAVTEAQSQLGKGYVVVGQGKFQTNCFSCVGLVEYAYDQVGASIIPEGEELPAITPLQQYRLLRPVDEITAQVGEQIRIPMKGLYFVQDPLIHTNNHYERTLLFPAATSLPGGSSYSGGLFEWTPQRTDAGSSHLVQFQMQLRVAGKERISTRNLTIHVQDASNQAPTAVDDAAVIAATGSVVVNVLTNDTDPDGDELTVTAVGSPRSGMAVRISGSTLAYTPTLGFIGTDAFTYTVSDGLLTDTASVNVTVSAAQPGWNRIQTADSPSARFGLGMAYDSYRNVSVLFGGAPADALAQTWEYDGANWRAVTTQNYPTNDTGRQWPTTLTAVSLSYSAEPTVPILHRPTLGNTTV